MRWSGTSLIIASVLIAGISAVAVATTLSTSRASGADPLANLINRTRFEPNIERRLGLIGVASGPRLAEPWQVVMRIVSVIKAVRRIDAT